MSYKSKQSMAIGTTSSFELEVCRDSKKLSSGSNHLETIGRTSTFPFKVAKHWIPYPKKWWVKNQYGFSFWRFKLSTIFQRIIVQKVGNERQLLEIHPHSDLKSAMFRKVGVQ